MFALGILAFASAAFAHSGVKNVAVKARMDSMVAIGSEMKTLGKMSKGAAPFDKTIAQAAASAIARHALATPALFEAEENDPKSEARPEIWANFADFTAKSYALNAIAMDHSTRIDTLDDLGLAVKALGAACQACHKAYRE